MTSVVTIRVATSTLDPDLIAYCPICGEVGLHPAIIAGVLEQAHIAGAQRVDVRFEPDGRHLLCHVEVEAITESDAAAAVAEVERMLRGEA